MNKKAVVLILTGVMLLTACNVNTDRTGKEKNSEKVVKEINTEDLIEEVTADPQNMKDEKTDVQEKEKTFRSELEASSGRSVLEFLMNDYDQNGTQEAFALMGKAGENQVQIGDYIGEVWYVTEKGAVKLAEQNEFKKGKVLTIKDQTYIVYEECYVSESRSLVWNVQEGTPVQLNLGNGMGFDVGDDGNPTIIGSAYDACNDGTGHTYKMYWLYYDQGIHEYGGIEISGEDFLQYKNADLTIENIKKKNGVVSDIYYRANGIININYIVPIEGAPEIFSNEYVTLQYADGVVTETEWEYGHYKPAWINELAVYPEEGDVP